MSDTTVRRRIDVGRVILVGIALAGTGVPALAVARGARRANPK